MYIIYLVITILFALLVTFSGVGKVRRDPRILQVIHEKVGVPLNYIPLLAACEFAGALGLLAGIWWPPLGVAGAIGLVVYFVGAIVAHLRVGDTKGIGPAVLMFVLAVGALTLRILAHKASVAG